MYNAKIKGSLAVVVWLVCICGKRTHMCVAEARTPWSPLGRYMSVVSGAIPRDCAHTCVLYKQGTRCYDLLRGCVGKYSSVAKCWLPSGIIPFDCAHACVLQKPGIGGRSWHLRCLRMFISMSMRVHVLADREAIGCHGSCDGDCADLFEIEESGIMGSSAVPVCCTRGLDCSQGALCLREHTHTH